MTTRHADINVCETTGAVPYVGLTGPFGFRPNWHNDNAAHGTAMASIIACRPYTTTLGAGASFAATGHAPDAHLVDVACSSYDGPDARSSWIFTDPAYLGGIQALREWIILNRPPGQTSAYVHVANFSIGGDSSPFSPISLALDALARDEDILLVAMAGNQQDTTISSNGFYHGLSVASVHARDPGNAGLSQPANWSFRPMLQSSTGPLFGDPARLFPDVCATGAGPGSLQSIGGQWQRTFKYPYNFTDPIARGTCLLMAGPDIADAASRAVYPQVGYNVSPQRWNYGTSEAAAQVSGAAALYRGYRASVGTPATAEETRAALLLNVLGTYTSVDGTTADPATQHTYTRRNRLGVGYVRDDLLAQFAVRDPAIRPLVQAVTLTAAAPAATVQYANLQPDSRYGVVCCWRRWRTDPENDGEVMEASLPNVDLEVFANGNRIARSATPANAYERLVFLAPASGGGGDPTTVTLQLHLQGSVPAGNSALEVYLVAREFASELDPATQVLDTVHAASGQVASVSAGTACTATSVAWQVERIIPAVYQNAYGSAPYGTQNEGVFPPNWFTHLGYEKGVDLAMVLNPPNVLQGPYHITILSPQVGGPIQIAGLAFRTWAPFETTTDLGLSYVAMWQGTDPTPTGSFYAPPASATVVVQPAGLRAPTVASEFRPDHFVVVLPFTTTFTYTGGTGNDLHIWIAPSGSVGFVVDGVTDGAPSPYSLEYVAQGALGTYVAELPGTAPILGLIPASAPASREVALEVFGEPWSGNGSATLAVDWRLSQMPAGATWVLWSGDWSSTSMPVGSCSLWLTNVIAGPAGVAGSDGQAYGSISIPPGLVHFEFGLQGSVLPQTLSNALRITVGGGL